jgi:hypothetical protein
MRINIRYALFVLASICLLKANGQETKSNKKFYSTSGGEIIFSWAEASKEGLDATVITRFSPVLNIQYQLHRDFSERIGFFTGIGIRNVGFIYDDPTEVNTRYKARSYTLGIPLALKVGNMKGFYFFGGYELELPFNYKEKKFVNDDKVDKITTWFSDRTPSFYQSYFLGFQTPYGTQIKFKYYMTNFFNKNYAANDGSGNTIYPYKDIEANVFYVSLSLQLFSGSKLYTYK